MRSRAYSSSLDKTEMSSPVASTSPLETILLGVPRCCSSALSTRSRTSATTSSTSLRRFKPFWISESVSLAIRSIPYYEQPWVFPLGSGSDQQAQRLRTPLLGTSAHTGMKSDDPPLEEPGLRPRTIRLIRE